MKRSVLIIVVITFLIISISGSFYAGIIYSKSQKIQPAFNGVNFQGMRNNKTGGLAGGNFTSGEILSKDNDSVTIKLLNNEGSKIIFFSETTQIMKSTSGTSEDLVTGIPVSVTGITNSDGSITAQSIQIKPASQNKPNF